MRIVLATSAFHHVGGSETYLLTLGENLVRLGHDVRVHARVAGDMAMLARQRGVATVDRVEDLGEPPDAVVSQDGIVAHDLAAAWPGVPQAFVCHSALHDVQQPPLVPGIVSTVIVLNERVRRRVEALNADLDVVRLTQPIDTQRFSPLSAPQDRPRRALVLSTYLDGAPRRAIEEVWGAAGVEVVFLGVDEVSLAPELAVNEVDIVVGKGRAVLEAMSCGRPAYLYDSFGGDGWVTPGAYPAFEADGFSGQQHRRVLDAAQLAADLAAYSPEWGRLGRELVLRHHDARTHAHDVLDVLRGLGAGPAAPRPWSRRSAARSSSGGRPRPRCSACGRRCGAAAPGPTRSSVRPHGPGWRRCGRRASWPRRWPSWTASASGWRSTASATAACAVGSDASAPTWARCASMADLRASERAPYLLVGPGVVIGTGVELGAHVVLHAGVVLRARARVDDGAVIGRRPRMSGGSGSPVAAPATTVIGEDAVVGCHSVVNVGAVLGPRSWIGDHCLVREGVRLGEDASIGHACTIGRDCVVGDRVRMQGYVGLASGVVVEDDCFFGAQVIVNGGLTMGSRPSGPPVIGRGSKVGSGSQLLPGIEVGAGSVIGAGSVVVHDVPSGAVVRGVPAR